MTGMLAIDGGTPVRTEPFGPMHDFGDEDIEALAEVVRSGVLGKGPKVHEFEDVWASRHGVEHAVGVTSGTAAMHTCVGAINPDPGDEIIVSPWTSGGSIIGALLHNCVPVFADIDDTYTLDPADVEAKITDRTRAIIAVHLFGNPCDMGALREIADRRGLFLIEDCCQAHFAEYQGQVVGSLGDIAGFSYGGKHLSAGEGGMVITNNRSLWERAVLFSDAALPRDEGPYDGRPYANYFLAPNYRMGSLTAAVLLTQMDKIDRYIENKIGAAENIIQGLSDVDEITSQLVRPGDRSTYWVLGLTLDTDVLNCTAVEYAEAVSAEGVKLGGPYIGSGRQGPLFRNEFLAAPNLYGRSRFPLDYQRETPVDYRQTRLPYGEELMARGVTLSMRPSFGEEDIGDIIHAMRKVAAAFKSRGR